MTFLSIVGDVGKFPPWKMPPPPLTIFTCIPFPFAPPIFSILYVYSPLTVCTVLQFSFCHLHIYNIHHGWVPWLKSSTISYHSGRIAVSVSRYAGVEKGVYTLVYEDCEGSPLIAYFTPSGSGCCYHHNGSLRMLFNKEGGSLFDEVLTNGCRVAYRDN